MKTISVVMATYNGEKYLRNQLDSIIPFLLPNDELIVSDDGSTDKTLDILNEYINRYPNIVLVDGPHQGVVKNFEFGLSKSTKDVVLICDQDDIWLPEKIDKMRNVFSANENLYLVLHDMFISNDYKIENNIEGVSSFERRRRKHGVFNNWWYSGYFGCCMGLSKSFLKKVLPFTKHVKLYDQWIGLLGEYYKSSLFINDKLIIHREHNNNVSKEKTSVLYKIKARFFLLLSYLEKKKNK